MANRSGLMFRSERGLWPRNLFLGEVSEGAVEAPSDDYAQNSREASRAPSARLASLAQTTPGSTAAWPTQVP